jgi:hypothetical protein
MAQEINRVNNIMANNIIKDSGIIAYLIKKYFRENHNIDLGEFQNKQFVSKEIAALDVSKNVIIDKYSFVCNLDSRYIRNVYIDVYIRYIGFEDSSIDASIPVTIDRFVMKYINDEDDTIESSMIKKVDIFSPLKTVGITKISSTFEYYVSTKFIKKEENNQ